MCDCHLARDVEAKSEAYCLRGAAISLSPLKWAEHRGLNFIRDGHTLVVDADRYEASLVAPVDGDGPCWVAINKRVPNEIREYLFKAIRVPDALQRTRTQIDRLRRVDDAQFLDDMRNEVAQVHRLPIELETTQETCSSQIQDLLDHAGHAKRAGTHSVEDPD